MWECDFPVAISATDNKIREMFVIIILDLPRYNENWNEINYQQIPMWSCKREFFTLNKCFPKTLLANKMK